MTLIKIIIRLSKLIAHQSELISINRINPISILASKRIQFNCSEHWSNERPRIKSAAAILHRLQSISLLSSCQEYTQNRQLDNPVPLYVKSWERGNPRPGPRCRRPGWTVDLSQNASVLMWKGPLACNGSTPLAVISTQTFVCWQREGACKIPSTQSAAAWIISCEDCQPLLEVLL
jgi:hypothetical protein